MKLKYILYEHCEQPPFHVHIPHYISLLMTFYKTESIIQNIIWTTVYLYVHVFYIYGFNTLVVAPNPDYMSLWAFLPLIFYIIVVISNKTLCNVMAIILPLSLVYSTVLGNRYKKCPVSCHNHFFIITNTDKCNIIIGTDNYGIRVLDYSLFSYSQNSSDFG